MREDWGRECSRFRAVGAMANPCFAHLGRPLLQALRRFLIDAAAVEGRTVLDRAIRGASDLQAILQRDLLLTTDVAASGRRGKFAPNHIWSGRTRKAAWKLEQLRKSFDQFKAKTSNRVAWRWAVMAGLGDPHSSTRSVESWRRDFQLPMMRGSQSPTPVLLRCGTRSPTSCYR